MGYRDEKSNINNTTLYDRVKKLLVSYEWSDCCFSVSEKTIKAHKLILGISSPVFEAMFYGPLSNTNDIIITDIQPDIFQSIVNYIYTDKVEITCIEQAFELLYASKKYMLEHLNELCITYIQSNICIDNVIDILNYPEYMQDDHLNRCALRLLCQHANYLLDENKSSITLKCMKAILESNQINIPEKRLIEHVFDWTKYYCEQIGVASTFENRRNILETNGLLKLLRFLSLSVDDFEEVTGNANNLLLPLECDDLLTKLNKPTTEAGAMASASVPRSSLKLHWHVCYRSPLRPLPPLVIDSNNHVIQARIKSKKSVFVNALCVPPRMAPAVYFRNNETKAYSEQLSVSIASEADNSIIKYTNFMNTVEFDSIVEIELTEPCFLKKDQWYLISFVWPENRPSTYSYFVEYRENKWTYGDQVMFEFDDMLFNPGNSGIFLEGLKFCL